MTFRIFFDGLEVTPYADWVKSEVDFTREENLRYSLVLRNVKFVEGAYYHILTYFPNRISVLVMIDMIELMGTIYPSDIVFFNNYVVVDVTISPLDLFTKRVEGILYNNFINIPVLISPKEGIKAILTLLTSTLSLTYIVSKEVFDISKDVALISGIAGAGPTGGISATLTNIAILAMRLTYLISLVISLKKLLESIFENIEHVRMVKGCNLADALTYFANIAGMQIELPLMLKYIYIVGDDESTYESGELFNLAKKLTNSYIYVAGNVIKFINANTSFPTNLRSGYEISYKYNYGEIARKEIISLIRDTSDDHCLDAPFAIEITRGNYFSGYTRVDINASPAQIAGNRRIFNFSDLLLAAISLFSQRLRVLNVTDVRRTNIIIAERDIFLRKIVYTDNVFSIANNAPFVLMQQIANHYVTNRVAKVFENVVIPMDSWNFYSLVQNGFPGVLNLRWNFVTKRAQISYKVIESANNDDYRII